MIKMIRANCFIMAITLLLLAGCTSKNVKNTNLDTTQNVSLVIAGSREDYKALETVINAFTKQYPNCSISYEYLQNYKETLPKRLEQNTDRIDMFIAGNVQADSTVLPYAIDLYAHNEVLDLSGTFDGLLENFEFMNEDPEAPKQIYSIPFGGELRGTYVNLTLLKSLDIKVPENREEFLEACKILSEAGYVPIQGNPGNAPQQLMYPYVCNLVANNPEYESVYTKINQCDEGISEMFRDPMEFAYTLMNERYYNYKYVESEYATFIDTSDSDYARYFLNIIDQGSGYEKKDDVGNVAFMPSALSLSTTLDKTRDDYHSQIEYEFILSPVSDEGGYAYLSPTNGLAINKNSEHTDWSLEFMNFLFESSQNIRFAEEDNIIPNTKDAYNFIKNHFDIPQERISHLGQVTFDYSFYNVINDSLVQIMKGNAPKYMNADEDGNLSIYPFDFYMQEFSKRFDENRKK